MRSPKLTETNEWHGGGRLCHSYEWRGSSVPVCDSCRNMLLVIELFADESFEPDEKFDILMPMLFPEPARVLELAGAEIGELLKAVLWQACGLDVSGSGEEHPQKVFDWDEDAARIKASLMSAYGLRWDDVADGCTFADACALLAMLMEDDSATPFQQAVYYRTAKPPKRTKGNSDYCDGTSAGVTSRCAGQATARRTPRRPRTGARATCSPR